MNFAPYNFKFWIGNCSQYEVSLPRAKIYDAVIRPYLLLLLSPRTERGRSHFCANEGFITSLIFARNKAPFPALRRKGCFVYSTITKTFITDSLIYSFIDL